MKSLVTILLVLLIFVGRLVSWTDIPGKKSIKGKLTEILFKNFMKLHP